MEDEDLEVMVREFAVVQDTVQSRRAIRLLYQAHVNACLYWESIERVIASLSRIRVGHTLCGEGIPATARNLSLDIAARAQLVGHLTSAVTAVDRFVRCLQQARKAEGSAARDWRVLRHEIDELERRYRPFRHFLEHMDERLDQSDPNHDPLVIDGLATSPMTEHARVNYVDRGASRTFDLSLTATRYPMTVYERLLEMLKGRRGAHTSHGTGDQV